MASGNELEVVAWSRFVYGKRKTHYAEIDTVDNTLT